MRRGIGRLRAGGGGGFSPASLFAAGEQGVWYDPSDFSTMFQDSAGTTPVTAVTQPVGKILDKSGRGNHATQATTTSRPTLQQDGSGFYYLNFDGVDDNMATGAFTLPNNPATMAAAAKIAAAGSIENIFDGVAGRMILGGTTGPAYRMYNGATLQGGAANSSNHVQLANFASASSTLEIDKSVVASGDAGTTAVANGLRIGCDNLVSTQFLTGRIYGAIALGRALSANEKASLYTYLGGKCGLAL